MLLTIAILAILATTPQGSMGIKMKTLTAKDAKYAFGRLIDLARAEPVAVAKHGRPVVVVLSVEEFERLKALDVPAPAPVTKPQESN
jgi:prevent-host-death family protein